jgi:hypothetical protein
MNPATRGNEGNANAPVLYIALELSNKTWKLVLGDGDRRRQVAVHAADLVKLGEALPVHRHAQGKHFHQPVLKCRRQLARHSGRAHAIALTAAAAFASSISQLVARAMTTFKTSFHRQTSLLLVRLG